MASRVVMSTWLLQSVSSGHFCSWHASMEKDQGKVVAGNIVTTGPIYLALMALRKKGVAGTEPLGRLIILAAPRFVTSASGAQRKPQEPASEPCQQAETAQLILVPLVCNLQEWRALSWRGAAALPCPAGAQAVELEVEQGCEIKSVPRGFGSAAFFMSSGSSFANETSH